MSDEPSTDRPLTLWDAEVFERLATLETLVQTTERELNGLESDARFRKFALGLRKSSASYETAFRKCLADFVASFKSMRKLAEDIEREYR